jgi:WD40 repeat protein
VDLLGRSAAGAVSSAAISGDGTTIATVSAVGTDSRLQIWVLSGGAFVPQADIVETDTITIGSFSADGSTLAVGDVAPYAYLPVLKVLHRSAGTWTTAASVDPTSAVTTSFLYFTPNSTVLSADASSMVVRYTNASDMPQDGTLLASEGWAILHPVDTTVPLYGATLSRDGSTLAAFMYQGAYQMNVYRKNGTGWKRIGHFTPPSGSAAITGAGIIGRPALSGTGRTLVVGWGGTAGLYRFTYDGTLWHFGGMVNNTPWERSSGVLGITQPVVSADAHRIIGAAQILTGGEVAYVFDAK